MQLLIIGGSDAAIMAGLRAREVSPNIDVTLLVADRYPNYSVCGIPFHVGGLVQKTRDLAHRSIDDLQAAGLRLRLGTRATAINPIEHTVAARTQDDTALTFHYDRLIVATGASPTDGGIKVTTRTNAAGLAGHDANGAQYEHCDSKPGSAGVYRVHDMADMLAIEDDLAAREPTTATVIGGGYIGLEMAEALRLRGLDVTMLHRGTEVLSTLDIDMGSLIHAELTAHGVHVHTGFEVHRITRTNEPDRWLISGANAADANITTGLIIIAAGIRPNTSLLRQSGARTGAGGAIVVDDHMRTNLPDIFAAGDVATTRHRLIGTTWLPLGTTAHKQGRVAGENAVGGDDVYAGTLGTQVVKVFSLVAARTGLCDDEARRAGFRARSVGVTVDDHKAYVPGARPLTIRLTGESTTGRLLGAQLVGSYGSEVAKRCDILATAIFAGLTIDQLLSLDLSYTPPIAAPWDAVQMAAQRWLRADLRR